MKWKAELFAAIRLISSNQSPVRALAAYDQLLRPARQAGDGPIRQPR